MPRIDPALLLNTLSVLLSPDGGIKECEDVQRVVNLMTRFSKKLISKCIYIRILLATDSALLDSFYSAGGWQLVYSWFADASSKSNWALVEALLALFKASPVSRHRLGSNDCAQLLKNLPADSLTPDARLLRDDTDQLWSRLALDDSVAVPSAAAAGGAAATVATNSDDTTNQPAAGGGAESGADDVVIVHHDTASTPATTPATVPATGGVSSASSSPPPPAPAVIENNNKWQMEVRDRVVVFKKLDSAGGAAVDSTSAAASTVAGDQSASSSSSASSLTGSGDSVHEQNTVGDSAKQSATTGSDVENDRAEASAKVDSSEDSAKDTARTRESARDHRAKKRDRSIDSDSDVRGRKRRSLDKSDGKKSSNTSVHKGSDRSSSGLSKSSSSHHASPAVKRGSHTKSHSSSKSKERDRKSRELAERAKQRQSVRDRETLAKVCAVGKVGGLAAIPKKSADAVSGGELTALKSSTGADDKATSQSSDQQDAKPPELRRATVKTFRGKFRSTGLESDVSTSAKARGDKSVATGRPRPLLIGSVASSAVTATTATTTAAAASTASTASATSSLSSEALHSHKRVLPANASLADKRSRLEQRQPVQRPGGIKITSPKPIQEATGFMEALNASADVKKKPAKKSRRLSSREDKKDDKETGDSGKSATATPAEQKLEDKPDSAPRIANPSLKFYQDTLDEKTADCAGQSAKQDKDEANPDDAQDDDVKAEMDDPDEEPPPPTNIPLERLPSVDNDSTTTTTTTAAAAASIKKDGDKPKGVLVIHRSASDRQKRRITWKPDAELVSVSYFDLDENERVNVNRAKFEEMQALEKSRERDMMRRQRDVTRADDGMREQMAWQLPLLLLESAQPLVEPGVNSSERHVQAARERLVFPFPFHPAVMPETASEPDGERPDTAEPACRAIPLHGEVQDGVSVKDYRALGWPAPKLGAAPPAAASISPAMGSAADSAQYLGNGVVVAGALAANHPHRPHPHQPHPLHHQHHQQQQQQQMIHPMHHHPQQLQRPRHMHWVGGGMAQEMSASVAAGGVFPPQAGLARLTAPSDGLMPNPVGWHGPPRGPFRGPGPMARGGAVTPLFVGAPGQLQQQQQQQQGRGPPVGLLSRMPGAAGVRGARGGRGGAAWRRDVVCKHFMAGHCRNGRMCAFLHPGLAKRPTEPLMTAAVPLIAAEAGDDRFV